MNHLPNLQEVPRARPFWMRGMIWALFAISVCNPVIAAPPMRFNYQAKLTDGVGAALEGSHTLFFSLWLGGSANSAGSGTKVFEEQATLSIVSGIASHAIGTGSAQVPGPFTQSMLQGNGDLFLQVGVDVASNVVLPRTRIESVPYAIVSADGEPATPISQPASFPIVISQPGSYCLRSNIVGVTGQHGISVTTGNVTLDLNGFELRGMPGSLRGINAISQNNIVVQNGTIREWGSDGIYMHGGAHDRVSDICARDNGISGIVTGDNSTIERCIAAGNVANGIAGYGGSIIVDCAARLNAGKGFQANTCTISRCTATFNSGTGFSVTLGGSISNCVAARNDSEGIVATGSCVVTNCTCDDNATYGIDVTGLYNLILNNNCSGNDTVGIRVNSPDNRVEGNNVVFNISGIKVDSPGNFISRNTCSGNGTNWDINAGNVILVVNAATSPAFTGNSGGVAPGSTDPNANFTY